MKDRIYRRVIAETAYVLLSTAAGTTVALSYPEHFWTTMSCVFGARAAFDLGRLVQRRLVNSAQQVFVHMCSE